MMTVVLLLSFTCSFLFFIAVLGVIYKNKASIEIRLEKLSRANFKTGESEMNQPLFTRLVKPVLDDISKTIIKATPKEFVNNYEKKIIMAGYPYNLSVNEWINVQLFMTVGLPVLFIILGNYIKLEMRMAVFLAIGSAVLGVILPFLIFNQNIQMRKEKIQNSLPNVLDLLTVSVEAGLGFDGALAKVIDKMPGPLADEFELVLNEIKVGKQKKDALKSMAERVNVPDLTTFVSSIIQAEQLGVSIGNVLRIQSEQMRQKRRQRAQEKAMKAPVKMLIPMILFIFPTIFFVLMGPMVIKIMSAFSK